MKPQKKIEELSISLDQGMALEWNGKIYHGANAIHQLSLLTTPSNYFNKINAYIFKNHLLTTILYPFLRLGRNLSITLLNRPQLTPYSIGFNAQLSIIGIFWGIFSILHLLVYETQFNTKTYPSTWIIGISGFILILKPKSKIIWLITLSASIFDALLQIPQTSNHTQLKNIFLLAITLSTLWNSIKGKSWEITFNDFAPIGRCLLLVMYFFGVFHKINSDFINPKSSCAITLWNAMPSYISWIKFPFFTELSIYGTLIIESVIFALLLMRRTRTYGIYIGIGFHSMLALSGYALYPPFSTLTIVLHLLFLSPASALQITQSNTWNVWTTFLHSLLGFTLLCIWILAMSRFSYSHEWSNVGATWLVAPMLLCWIIAHHGKVTKNQELSNAFLSKLLPINILSFYFFLSCAAPYFGLKTAQSMNMFANLSLENGHSNHLILNSPPVLSII